MATAHYIVAEVVPIPAHRCVDKPAITHVITPVETVMRHVEVYVGKAVAQDAQDLPINIYGYNWALNA